MLKQLRFTLHMLLWRLFQLNWSLKPVAENRLQVSVIPPHLSSSYCHAAKSHFLRVIGDQSSGFSRSTSPLREGQMVLSAGLLRARHECGLSSLRSLCRLMPAWISVNLCQTGRIKENIYNTSSSVLVRLRKESGVFSLFGLLESTAGELEANLTALD